MGDNTERFRTFLASDDVMVMDGAMGTELNKRGVRTTLPLWSALALIDAPDTVSQIHIDHITAGARIVTTNTFRTSLRSLGKAGMAPRASELTTLAVDLAKRAREHAHDNGIADGDGVFIAGSIAPLEDCYRPQLAPDRGQALKEHRLMARALTMAGVDVLLAETMNTLEEAGGAVEAAMETGLPVMVSFTLSPDGDVLGGDPLEGAVKEMESLGADVILLNCFPAPDMGRALKRLRDLTTLPIGAYANMGIPDDVEGWEAKGVLSPEEYGRHADTWLETGVRLLGGCCGTGIEHIEAIQQVVSQYSD